MLGVGLGVGMQPLCICAGSRRTWCNGILGGKSCKHSAAEGFMPAGSTRKQDRNGMDSCLHRVWSCSGDVAVLRSSCRNGHLASSTNWSFAQYEAVLSQRAASKQTLPAGEHKTWSGVMGINNVLLSMLPRDLARRQVHVLQAGPKRDDCMRLRSLPLTQPATYYCNTLWRLLAREMIHVRHIIDTSTAMRAQCSTALKRTAPPPRGSIDECLTTTTTTAPRKCVYDAVCRHYLRRAKRPMNHRSERKRISEQIETRPFYLRI